MTDQQEVKKVAQAMQAGRPVVVAAEARGAGDQRPPVPDAIWQLPGGTAWVYFGNGNPRLTKPVILADGFNSGPSTLEFSWNVLEAKDFGLISALRERGRDVVLLGFTERSASILDNAKVAESAIMRTIGERQGDIPLAVGGFSMGGLVTRYALAQLETQRMDHQTALYWSYDSPHRGAWIPLALQAFAHYSRDFDPRFSNQINSPAARELLAWHIADWNDPPEVSKERAVFLEALARVGSWPMRPRTIGVANGLGNGTGNGISSGVTAFEGIGLNIAGTELKTQAGGEQYEVAKMRLLLNPVARVSTTDLPTFDGAPGGTLDGFGLLADTLNDLGIWAGMQSRAQIRDHCFVPAVSAVAIRDVDTEANLYTDIDSLPPDQSDLDEFRTASANQEHTKITEELCTWILDRLP